MNDKFDIPDNMMPLLYLVVAVLAAIGLQAVGVDDTTRGMIVGAALTRVKMPTPKQ